MMSIILEYSLALGDGYGSIFKLMDIGQTLRLTPLLVGMADDFFQIGGSTLGKHTVFIHAARRNLRPLQRFR